MRTAHWTMQRSGHLGGSSSRSRTLRCGRGERKVKEPITCECRNPAPYQGRVFGSTAPARLTLNSSPHPKLQPHAYYSSPVRLFKPFHADAHSASRVPPIGIPGPLATTRRQLYGPPVPSRPHCLFALSADTGRDPRRKERQVKEPLACECRNPAPSQGRVSASMAPMRPTCTSNTHPELPPYAYYSPRVRPFKASPAVDSCAFEFPVLQVISASSRHATGVKGPGEEKQDPISGTPVREGEYCDA